MKINVITIECFKEPQESEVFVLCPIVWSCDCCWRRKCTSDALRTFPLLSCGGTTMPGVKDIST